MLSYICIAYIPRTRNTPHTTRRRTLPFSPSRPGAGRAVTAQKYQTSSGPLARSRLPPSQATRGFLTIALALLDLLAGLALALLPCWCWCCQKVLSKGGTRRSNFHTNGRSGFRYQPSSTGWSGVRTQNKPHYAVRAKCQPGYLQL